MPDTTPDPAQVRTEAHSWRDRSPEDSARRHPVPVCTDFQPGDRECSAFWCQTCGWNEPLHRDDDFRAAVAAELRRLAAAPTTTTTPEEH